MQSTLLEPRIFQLQVGDTVTVLNNPGEFVIDNISRDGRTADLTLPHSDYTILKGIPISLLERS